MRKNMKNKAAMNNNAVKNNASMGNTFMGETAKRHGRRKNDRKNAIMNGSNAAAVNGNNTITGSDPVNPDPASIPDTPVLDTPVLDTPTLDTPVPEEYETDNKFIWLNNSELQISPEIQRKLDPVRVKRIVNNFDPRVANPVKVSCRDGGYFMFDGMHTRNSMEIVYGKKDFPVLCRVYYGLTREDEARLFAMQFGYSEPVSMAYRIRALAVAKDAEILDFIKSTQDAGFEIPLGNSKGKNGRIVAVCEALKAYRVLGRTDYTRMLKTIHKTWAGDSWSVTKYMISGMTRFMKMYEFDMRAFVKAFREVTYEDIKNEVSRFPGMSRDGAFAAALAELYEFSTEKKLKEVV